MKPSAIVGILAAMTVLVAAIMSSSKSPAVFLDPHGILIVMGGTAAASLICYPPRFFVQVAKVFFTKFLRNSITRYETVIHEIVDLAEGVRKDPNHLKNRQGIKTPFLGDAIGLIAMGGISPEQLSVILRKRAMTQRDRNQNDADVFKTLSRFPPAFGLMGTTLGMIALLQNLGSKDGFKLLGPAMAIGLVATFYGIALANLIFIPLAENLAVINREDEVVREIVLDGMRLLLAKEHPRVIEEHLKSYLLPRERAELEKLRTRRAAT